MNFKYFFGNEYDERTESNLIGKRDLTDERKNYFSELVLDSIVSRQYLVPTSYYAKYRKFF